jgi:hypothetical protein
MEKPDFLFKAIKSLEVSGGSPDKTGDIQQLGEDLECLHSCLEVSVYVRLLFNPFLLKNIESLY